MRRAPQPKYDPKAIQQSVPLSRHPRRPSDPLSACNLCGLPPGSPEDLVVFREHDERDWPIAGDAALVFVARDHERCSRAVTAHPRLYARETGVPGSFPRLCGPCEHRAGLACRNPRAKVNGGEGVLIQVTNGLPPGVVCILPRPRIVLDAIACDQRLVR